jgi:peroxiredoxin
VQDGAARDKRTERLVLPRLCGQPVLLLFWKSWSRPCLTELRRLQRVQDEASEGPVIVAVGDGEQPERVREIAQEHGLRFTLVPDPTSELARRYRVACWPTTVWIDEQGLIQRVHFGVTPDRSGVMIR